LTIFLPNTTTKLYIMKLTLTLLALAASVIAAPVAVPEAKPEAEAAPQGTYATYGKLKLA
jgi:hypothetical protein